MIFFFLVFSSSVFSSSSRSLSRLEAKGQDGNFAARGRGDVELSEWLPWLTGRWPRVTPACACSLRVWIRILLIVCLFVQILLNHEIQKTKSFYIIHFKSFSLIIGVQRGDNHMFYSRCNDMNRVSSFSMAPLASDKRRVAICTLNPLVISKIHFKCDLKLLRLCLKLVVIVD